MWILLLCSLILYSSLQSQSIYGGDAGDLVTAAFSNGIAHPPGYPLYTLIGGWLTKIPIHSVAWRVGLLSSIPAAVTLCLLFFLARRLTRNYLVSLIAVTSLGFSYLYWLYASVPEVFALLLLFITSHVVTLYLWSETKNKRLLYLFSLLFGLSLAHHHFIICMVPAYWYLFFVNRKRIKLNTKSYIYGVGLVLIGLLPYVYVYVAARGIPIVDWEHPTTLVNFFRLVTRAYYGTFQISVHYAETITSRLSQLVVYWELLKQDFTLLSLFFIAVGVISHARSRSRYFPFFLLAFLFCGPFFFLYASFLVSNSFQIATFERFMLPSYLFLTIWFAYGLSVSQRAVDQFAKKRMFPYIRRPAVAGIMFVLIAALNPLSLFIRNVHKIAVLKNDTTAERYAFDMLHTVEQNAVIFPIGDTPFFDLQYVSTAEKKRPDVAILHARKVLDPRYAPQVRKFYPIVQLPDTQTKLSVDDLTPFFELNYGKVPIYATEPIPTTIEDGVWVQYGLLTRFYRTKDLPSKEFVAAENKRLWLLYQNPLSGALNEYKHLMLFHVVDYYAKAHIDTGNIMLRLNDYGGAAEHFSESIRLLPEKDDGYRYLGIAYFGMKKCTDAITNFTKAIELNPAIPEYNLYLVKTYTECLNDEKKASDYQKIFEQLQQSKETPLDQL